MAIKSKSPDQPRLDQPLSLAERMSRRLRGNDGYRRETFALSRNAARAKAREMLKLYPKAAYMTEIESWRELPGDRIEFTMRRLPSAD